jgi:hypothetical protein
MNFSSIALKPRVALARPAAPANFKHPKTRELGLILQAKYFYSPLLISSQSSFAALARPLAPSRKVLASAENGTETASSGWDHVLVAIIDSNPSLSTSSRQALASAASLATSALTVLFLDDEGKPIDTSRSQNVQKQLEERGAVGRKVVILEESIEHSSGKGSVAVGEAADSTGADLVVLSSAAVHDKHVDANLLAEFVPAPLLLLP